MKKSVILNEAEEIASWLVRHRRWLHEHAETGFELQQTHNYVKNTLLEIGLMPEQAGTMGIVCEITGRKPGSTFLLRADMDGLPIHEESGESFSCPDGRMHACGHDMHTAMLLGAARLLYSHRDELTGTVRFLFQPAEETLSGAQDMIKAGVLKGVDAAMMIHVMTGIPIPVGTAVVSAPGVSAPGADYFTIRIEGKGCHGAAPQNGVDPVVPAAHILLGLQEISTRELSISDKAVLTVGSFQAGSAPNMIPQRAVLEGTLRSYDENTRCYIKDRITRIAKGISEAFRADTKVVYSGGCPSFLNDEALCGRVYGYLSTLLGPERALSAQTMASDERSSQAGGSEDFAYISREVPSVMVALAAGEPERGYSYPLHHPKVRFDETALPVGSAIMAFTAKRWLSEKSQ